MIMLIAYEFRDLSTEIQIPARIDRGPTDILKAISATVGTDYTAPDYRLDLRRGETISLINTVHRVGCGAL